MKGMEVRRGILVLLLCAVCSLAANGVPATVLTSTGQIADGLLSGLGPVLRLLRPEGTEHVGPDAIFDIPLESIIQISIDFPRVIVETETDALIGPYSAFLGIGEYLKLDRGTAGPIELPTSALRAIALHGHSLRSVPRAWTGMGFLTEPEIFGATPLVDTECDTCTISVSRSRSADEDSFVAVDDGDELVYSMTPTVLPESDDSGIPWWVGLLGVAGIIGLFYILSATSSSG